MEKKIATIVICFMFVSFGLSAAIRAEDPNLATVFSYQGRLETAGSGDPLSGSYDFKFRVYDTPLVGTGIPIGDLMEVPNIPVTEGIFTVQLDPDPGGTAPNLFNGEVRYLEIDVRGKDDPNYFTISPRQRIHAAPYAITASSARWLRGRNSTEKVVYVDDSGNVGIGTTSPRGKLEVSHDGATTDLVVDANGNVGIVNEDPEYRLEVGNTSETNNYMRIRSKGAAGLMFYDGQGSYSGMIQYHHDDDEMRFRTIGGEVMRITDDGKVGIGTTSPTAKLEVNGTIVSQNIVYKTDTQYEKNVGLHLDNHLKFYMKPNTKYQFEFNLSVYRENGHEILYNLDPGNGVLYLNAHTMEYPVRHGASDNDPYPSSVYCARLIWEQSYHYRNWDYTGDACCKIWGVIENGSYGDDLQLRWGPVITNTNNNPYVRKGSYVIYREIP